MIMATIKSYSDLEQSRKLAEILPLETADMYIVFENNAETRVYYGKMPTAYFVCKPCWSLAALLGVLPDELEDNHFLTLEKEGKEYCCCYEDINGNSFRHTFTDNPVDACYEMILKLNELNLL